MSDDPFKDTHDLAPPNDPKFRTSEEGQRRMIREHSQAEGEIGYVGDRIERMISELKRVDSSSKYLSSPDFFKSCNVLAARLYKIIETLNAKEKEWAAPLASRQRGKINRYRSHFLKAVLNAYFDRLLKKTSFSGWRAFPGEQSASARFPTFSQFYGDPTGTFDETTELENYSVSETSTAEISAFLKALDIPLKLDKADTFEPMKLQFRVPEVKRLGCCEYRDFEFGVMELIWFDKNLEKSNGWSGHVFAISEELVDYSFPHAMVQLGSVSSVRFDTGFLARIAGGADYTVFLPIVSSENPK